LPTSHELNDTDLHSWGKHRCLVGGHGRFRIAGRIERLCIVA